mmetsp:Transcript_22863/g.51059  ORF Transcript_22863/g.51059 Transcript_22863/m.51059 type:complete len:433 (-) Transcript_22863:1328-2626(-)
MVVVLVFFWLACGPRESSRSRSRSSSGWARHDTTRRRSNEPLVAAVFHLLRWNLQPKPTQTQPKHYTNTSQTQHNLSHHGPPIRRGRLLQLARHGRLRSDETGVRRSFQLSLRPPAAVRSGPGPRRELPLAGFRPRNRPGKLHHRGRPSDGVRVRGGGLSRNRRRRGLSGRGGGVHGREHLLRAVRLRHVRLEPQALRRGQHLGGLRRGMHLRQGPGRCLHPPDRHGRTGILLRRVGGRLRRRADLARPAGGDAGLRVRLLPLPRRLPGLVVVGGLPRERFGSERRRRRHRGGDHDRCGRGPGRDGRSLDPRSRRVEDLPGEAGRQALRRWCVRGGRTRRRPPPGHRHPDQRRRQGAGSFRAPRRCLRSERRRLRRGARVRHRPVGGTARQNYNNNYDRGQQLFITSVLAVRIFFCFSSVWLFTRRIHLSGR